MEKQEQKQVGELKQRIAELESEVRTFQYVNEELVQAVNSTKARQLLNFLFKKASAEQK